MRKGCSRKLLKGRSERRCGTRYRGIQNPQNGVEKVGGRWTEGTLLLHVVVHDRCVATVVREGPSQFGYIVLYGTSSVTLFPTPTFWAMKSETRTKQELPSGTYCDSVGPADLRLEFREAH